KTVKTDQAAAKAPREMRGRKQLMGAYRSSKTHEGKRALASRALCRATGMKNADFGRPIIAVVNSFTQFVPGHVHLKDLGQLVAGEIMATGGVAKEFNTIAVDDGIAMGHDGMLYSLPSRELIADSVEYMVNAHCADAMVCISNCDKITPGMLMAALRINIPTVFVSGGPMESGKIVLKGKKRAVDLIDAMVAAADSAVSDADVEVIERSACPTCGSCSGMFTANSMNCLTEALGLALPGNGSTLATHAARRELFVQAGRTVMELATRWYRDDDASALPRSIATRKAFENAMALDVAMGGSGKASQRALELFHAAPGGVRTTEAFSTTNRWSSLDTDAEGGCIRNLEHAYTADGGLAVLYGNLAEDGAVIKTAGIPEDIWRF